MIYNQLINGLTEEVTPMIPEASIDLIACDPPFNIGLRYRDYWDSVPYKTYVHWSRGWVAEAHRILKPFGSIYVCIGDEYAAEIKIALQDAGFYFRNWIVWHYTFGQNQRLKFSRCHTHILYFTKSPDVFTFNADDIMIPSARQLIYKDKRANGRGKVPDDIWAAYADANAAAHELKLYPDELTTWNDSRLCGTFSERINDAEGSSHACQMPLSVMERIIKASSNAGDVVLDQFAGSGTTLVAAMKHGRKYLGIEMDPAYCKIATDRLAELAATP